MIMIRSRGAHEGDDADDILLLERVVRCEIWAREILSLETLKVLEEI